MPLSAKTPPQGVLIINQSDVSIPWWFSLHAEIRSKLASVAPGQISFYEEYLDFNRFRGPQYEQSLLDYFRGKYSGVAIDVIVAVGASALEHTLRLRSELGAGIPIVFAMIDEKAEVLTKSYQNFTGTTVNLELRNMVTAARALVSNLTQIVLVGDPYEGQALRGHYKSQVSEVSRQLQVVDLTGLSMGELKKRLEILPQQAAILYTSIFTDGDGVTYIPREALAILAERANRPIVIEADTQFGYGGTGGFVLSPKPVADAVAAQVSRILAGESASAIPLVKGNLHKPVFDWRELKRWNISENSLPPGSEIRFVTPSIWQQYRWQMVAIAATFLLQAGMIMALWIERHRRKTAELALRGQLLEIVHLNRAATAGILSASFAHELNQPLATILINAEAAELYLENKPPDVNGVKAILAEIRRDDERAGEIIRRLRGLLTKKSDSELEKFDVNGTIQDAFHLLQPEAKRRRIELSFIQASDNVHVLADPVHLMQVILNMAANGMDAMANCPPSGRKMILQTKLINSCKVEVSVSDTGIGIPEDKLKDIFKPFFTTKPQGTGIGLAIAQAITDIYGGKIWAENRPEGGAKSCFRMPLAKVKSS